MSDPNLPPIVLPPLDEYSLVGIWISSVLYGMKSALNLYVRICAYFRSVLLYGSCLFVIFRRRNSWTWFLVSTSTVLFIIVSMHIGASLRQLIEAFINLPKLNIPEASILYWINLSAPPNRIKAMCYVIADIVQDVVLIWRLYMVYGNSLTIVLLPSLLELAHVGVGLYGDVITMSTGSLTETPALKGTAIAAWALVLAVNVGTTCAIAGRLFYMGRKGPMSLSWSAGGGTSKNRYLSSIYTLIECGAIFTLSNVVLVAMYAQGDAKLQTAVNVTTQLAALTPFLIIVRAGFGLVHGAPSQSNATATLPALSVRMPPTGSSRSNVDDSNVDYSNGYPLKQTSIRQGTYHSTELEV
ncbi:hypothetical protein DFH06DRAFT_1120287 [Mycena polygramma]|nr:hypothetical protein DFH06DRAFT_1120287 [Mycena polygramma]